MSKQHLKKCRYAYDTLLSKLVAYNSSLTEITSCVSLQNWACLLEWGRRKRLSNVLPQETYKQQPAVSGLFFQGEDRAQIVFVWGRRRRARWCGEK